MKVAFLASLFILSTAAFAQQPFADLILTETKGIGILKPTFICSGEAIDHCWTGDGKFLLVSALELGLTPAVVRNTIANPGLRPSFSTPKQTVWLYDVDRETSLKVWQGTSPADRLNEIVWIPARSQFLVSVELQGPDSQPGDTHSVLAWLSPVNGKLTQLYQGSVNEFVNLNFDPSGSSMVLMSRKVSQTGSPGFETLLTWVGKDGRLGRSIKIDPELRFQSVEFEQGTGRPFIANWLRSKDKKPVREWRAVDFVNSTIVNAPAPKISVETEPNLEFELQPGPTLSRSMDVSKSLKGAWIVAKAKGPNQNGLIAAEVQRMSLAPTGTAVFYTTNDNAFVRPLAVMPKELALKALDAAQRTKMMSETKQVATAFMMFAADNDDLLPAPTSDWNGNLQPYIGNASMLDGFVYTFGGGNMADVSDPAGTVLGYKQGVGGRAVAYVDGHVKWIPDK